MEYDHQFTSPYPPEEFLRRFTPEVVESLGDVGYKLTEQSDDTLVFERQKRRFRRGLADFLAPAGNVYTVTIMVERYEHGSLVTVAGSEADVLGRGFDNISVWK